MLGQSYTSCTRQALAVASVIALLGCQQVEQATQDVIDETKSLFSSVPPDDGTSCYQPQRVGFYESANDAAAAESVMSEIGQIVSDFMTTQLAGTYSAQVASLLDEDFTGTMQSVITDIQNDTTNVQSLTNDFNALLDCRRDEATAINEQYKAGTMDRATAEARLAELRTLTLADIERAKEANTQVAERNSEYQLAAKQAREDVSAAPTEETKVERNEKVEQADEAVQTNQQALNESVASVDQAEMLVSDTEGEFNLEAFAPGRRLLDWPLFA